MVLCMFTRGYVYCGTIPFTKKQTQPLVGYDHRSAYSMCPFWEDVPQEPDMSLLFAVHTPVLASLMFGYLFNYMVSD